MGPMDNVDRLFDNMCGVWRATEYTIPTKNVYRIGFRGQWIIVLSNYDRYFKDRLLKYRPDQDRRSLDSYLRRKSKKRRRSG